MITIIHPSRSRPQLAFETAMKWITKSGLEFNEFEYILSLDSDDPKLWAYQRPACHVINSTRLINLNKSAIEAINIAAAFYSKHRGKLGDFLIVISDDFDCPDNWGVLLKPMSNIQDWLLKTQDGIQPWIVTLPIMDWAYYNRFGYVYHSSYSHMFADTEMTCVGELTGRLHRSELRFSHLCESIAKDELNKRNDATFEEGRRNFIERKRINFDLPEGTVFHSIPDNVYTRMT